MEEADFDNEYKEILAKLQGKTFSVKITDPDGIQIFQPHEITDPFFPLLQKVGMPPDKEIGLKFILGEDIGEEYKDFCLQQILVICDPPPTFTPEQQGKRYQKGKYTFQPSDLPGGFYEGNLTTPDGKQSRRVFMRIWRQRVFLVGSAIYYEEVWNGEKQAWLKNICNIPDPITPQVIAELQRLAIGTKLPFISIIESRSRRLKLTDEKFLEQGLQVAEAAAKAGVKTWGYKQFAPFFAKLGSIRDRDTVKAHAVEYKEEWRQIIEKFDKTWEWRRANDPKLKAALVVRNMRNLR